VFQTKVVQKNELHSSYPFHVL